ncbi:tol-pal system-associated acyl-CoA thioesterase [Alphaproteobacteria bacterium]|nr:tol-pal system-associated acyl-CoA thioesterase [Alphaproteobacteria bacterium]
MSNNLNTNRTFNFPIKVYYEDTDAEGVVYYANYLKFIERARTEMINACDTSLKILHKDHDSRFIVKICNLDFIKSAHLEDVLEVKTSLKKLSNASFVLNQNIFYDEHLILKAEVVIVCINRDHKPSKIPDFLKKKIQQLIS